MAAALSLTQLSSGNPIYDKYYRQVDPTNSGRVAAPDAATFLKRSGLADLVLGKIWDVADSERKGSLNKQQFFVALRLVACAQNGLEVALKSLNVAVPPPKFHDTSSPLLPGGVPPDYPWVVKSEEKMKFDSIFDSLGPVGGMLSGDKVKPVLLNSKLPVDVLGRVWELSDIDRDGMLDRDEFSVAMYLVYRALEGEPVPMSLPPPLVPPSKRKKPSVPSVMPLLPSPPSAKDRSSSHSKTLPHPPKPVPVATPAPAPVQTPAATPWVVSPVDKAKYDELFTKTDSDMDGLVSGPEVRDIFLKTGLPSATLARIWELCDIGDVGKLTREQFALALHLINQKLTKGLEPPQSLSPEMIPPSDRQNIKQNNLAADFSAIKELDSLSNEIVELQREKSTVEEEIKEKEEAIRQRTTEVQDLQDEVAKETEELSQLQTQRQKVQEALEELDQQKSSLEEQLSHIRQQTNQEHQLITSLQSEHEEQEQRICQFEEELVQAREELLALQEESRKLQEKVQAAKEQLTPLQESVRDSFTQVGQVQQKLNDLQIEERSVTAQLSWKRALEDSSPVPVLVNGAGPTADMHQADPFQQDLLEDDQPNDLKLETPAVNLNIQADQTEVSETTDEESKEESSPEEEKSKPDALDDLYTSLATSDIYNTFSSLAKPWDAEKEQSNSTPDISLEVVEDEDLPKASSPTVTTNIEPLESESNENSDPPETAPTAPSPSPPSSAPHHRPTPLLYLRWTSLDQTPLLTMILSKMIHLEKQMLQIHLEETHLKAQILLLQTLSLHSPQAHHFPQETLSLDQLTHLRLPPMPQNQTCLLRRKVTFQLLLLRVQTPSAPSPQIQQEQLLIHLTPQKTDGKSDPFSSSPPSSDLAVKDTATANDPFAPGGTSISTCSDPDPFAAVFGNESFGGGFADFSALAKSNGEDFGINNKNIFQEDTSDVPPALPPKTGTPTRPPPPPPGKRSSISRTESTDSFHRRGNFLPQSSSDFSSSSSSSSLPAKDPLADPFAPSSLLVTTFEKLTDLPALTNIQQRKT
ncbi:hypothetical protein WMY93_025338 [Mugilogobius chulae]|uniref:Epidermal growth factor receptor pathway substrate 15 n=1 Tax=Mugilogobius chulae TaxID=88201 RepID=A0AAW0N372_9GOBI